MTGEDIKKSRMNSSKTPGIRGYILLMKKLFFSIQKSVFNIQYQVFSIQNKNSFALSTATDTKNVLYEL